MKAIKRFEIKLTSKKLYDKLQYIFKSKEIIKMTTLTSVTLIIVVISIIIIKDNAYWRCADLGV